MSTRQKFCLGTLSFLFFVGSFASQAQSQTPGPTRNAIINSGAERGWDCVGRVPAILGKDFDDYADNEWQIVKEPYRGNHSFRITTGRPPGSNSLHFGSIRMKRGKPYFFSLGKIKYSWYTSEAYSFSPQW